MNCIKDFACGVIIGIANIIPGVSGGTMAVILNVYDKILYAFSLKNLKSNTLFLGFLGLGTGCGILAFSRTITFLYENYYMVVNFCFIGLVLGSVPMIYEKAKFSGIQAKNWIPFVLTLLFMIAIAIIKIMNEEMHAGEVTQSGVTGLPFNIMLMWLFIAAFISTIAMILPGISGSFMLLLFGCYTIVMKAIADMNFIVLFITALGVGSGGLVGIKLVKIMLRKHPQALYFAILGLVVGSIFSIFPGLTMDLNGLYSIIGMTICTSISYLFGKIGK